MRVNPVGATPAIATTKVQPVPRLEHRPQEENVDTARPVEQEQERDVQLKPEELRKALQDVNKTILLMNERMEFRIHDETNRVLVRVIDKQTDEVVKEIPPEKFLDMVAKLQELVGVLVDTRA